MSQRNPLDFLFDSSVGSGSSKLDELLGIRPITEEERAARRQRPEERATLGTANKNLPPEARALLSTIAGTESPDYRTVYGGRKVEDLSWHPGIDVPIQGGPNAGRTSSAAGRYQFLKSTWEAQAKKLGLKDFSPESQDIAAWDLATSTYGNKTGRDLLGDLRSKDPRVHQLITSSLAPVWTSLPGGIEQGQNHPAYLNRYRRALAQEIGGAPSGAYLDVSNPNSPAAQLMGGAQTQPEAPSMVPVVLSTGETISVEPGTSLEDVARILKENGEDATPMRGFQTVQGETINVPYNMSDEAIQHTLRRDAPELTVAKGEVVPDYTSLGAAGKQAIKSSLAQLGLGGAELAKAAGAEGIAKSAEEWAREKQKEAEAAFEMPTEEQAGWLKRKVGIPLTQVGAGIAPILPAMAISGPAGLATAAGLMGTQELGALKERAEAQGKDFKLGEAAPYAAAVGAVNLLPWGRIAPLFRAASEDAMLGSREAIRALVEKEGVETAQQKLGTYMGQALKNAGLTEAAGASADLATSVLERAYTDKPLWDKDAFEEYKDTLAQGAPFYTLTGAGAGIAGRHIKATELEKVKEQQLGKEQIAAQKLEEAAEAEGVEVPEGAPEVVGPRLSFEVPAEMQGLPNEQVLDIMEAQGTLPENARELYKQEKARYRKEVQDARKIQGAEQIDAGRGPRSEGGEEVGYPTEGGEGVRISDQEGQGLAGEGETLKAVTQEAPRARSAAEMFEPERLEQAKTPGYKSRDKLIEMPITDFLKLSEKLDGAVEHKREKLAKSLESGEKLREFPQLWFTEKDGQQTVTGHEGRHRAMALLERGYTHMPVLMRSGEIRWSEQAEPNKFDYQEEWPETLKGQEGDVVPFPIRREEAETPYTAIEEPSTLKEVTESPDLGRLPLDVAKFTHAKNGRDVVDAFLQHGTDENLLRKAKLFKASPRLGSVEVNFVSLQDKLPNNIREAFEKKSAGAVTSFGDDKVQVYYRKDDPESFSEDNVIHEITHAMTEGGLSRNPELTKELEGLAGTIHTALAQDHPEAAEFWNGVVKGDSSEALAYGTTSPTFRDILSQYDENGVRIPEKVPEAAKPRTLWDKFKDFMSRVFGIPTGRRAEFAKNVDEALAANKAPVVKAMTTRLDQALMQAYRETAEKGIIRGEPRKLKAVQKAFDDEGIELAREAHAEQPKDIGLAGKLKDRSFGEKLADGVRDVFKEGRRTSFTSEWFDMYDDLGKAVKDRPMMVDHKAAVDMVASAYSQAGNLLTDAVHNGYIIPNGDGTYRVNADKQVALERIFRDITDAGKTDKFNNMLVGLIARTIKAEDQKKKDAAANYETMANDLRFAAKGMEDKKKAKRYVKTAKALEAKAEELTQLFQNQYESRTWATDEQIKMAEALEASDPQLASEAQNVYKLLKTCVDNLESSGVISKEFADFCRTRPNYIPLYKNLEHELKKDFDSMIYDPTNHALVDAFRSSMRSPKRQPGIKQQKRHFHDVMVEANLLKHLAMTTMMSMRNDLNRAFAEQLSVTGGAERVKHKEQADLTVMENGSPAYYKVYDKEALFALMGAQPLVNPIFRQMKKVSNLVRGVMVMNPLFWFRQLVREPLTASAVARVGMVTPFDTMAQLAKIAVGKGDWYEKLKRRGVVAAQDVITDPVEFTKYVGKQKGWVSKGVDQIKKIHEAVDGATRAVVAEKAYKQAISEGFSPEDAENIAAIKAREIINFARQGRSELSRTMRAVTPFFGAALNGLHVAAKAMAPEKIGRLSKAEAMEQRRIFYTRAALVAMYTSAYAMAMSDDEDYLKSTERAANWFIPTGDKDEPFIKEPIQFELGVFLKTIPEALVLANMGAISTERAAKEIGKTVWDTVIPPFPMIYAIKPMAEAAMNFDFHNWAPIESRGDSEKLAYLRDRRAGELTKGIAKELHKVGVDAEVLSPDRMERVMEGYFGQLWALSRVASDYALYNGPEKPEKILADQPFFKGVLVKGTKDSAVEDFYDVYEQVKQFAATESAARTKGNVEILKVLKEDPKFKNLMQSKESLKAIMDNLSETSANIERVTNLRDLSAKEKSQRIKNLEEQRNRIAAQGIKLARRWGFDI